MTAISRRTFLGGIVAGAAATVVRGSNAPAAELDGDTSVFPHGVASGDPSTDGVVLWTRLDPERFHGRDVAWEVFPAGDPTNVLATGGATVDGERDGTVHVPVGGLPASPSATGSSPRAPGAAARAGASPAPRDRRSPAPRGRSRRTRRRCASA